MAATQSATTAKTKDQKRAERKVMTPKFRVSFPQVFKPKAFEGGEPKYSIVMLFDKKADITPLKKAAFVAATEKWGPKENWPKKLRMPFRDGDEDKPDTDGYAGCIFISASARDKPGVIDAKFINGEGDRITEEDGRFYAGCYARATVQAFCYDKGVNKGVSFGLLNIQKLGDGKPFSGRLAPEKEFDSVEDVAGGPDDSDESDTAAEENYDFN